MVPQALNLKTKHKPLEQTQNEGPSALTLKTQTQNKGLQPSALNIERAPKSQNTQNIGSSKPENLCLSYEYIKKKVPNINAFMYSQLKNVLSDISTNKDMDTDVLNLGKTLQEQISNKIININSFLSVGSEQLKRIQESHKSILEVLAFEPKEGLFQKLFGQNTGLNLNVTNKVEFIQKEFNNNKDYRNDLEELSKKYPLYLRSIEQLIEETSTYNSIFELLIQEFTELGLNKNIDLINRRVVSMNQSLSILRVTLSLIESDLSKINNYIMNIDNVVFVYLPLVIVKLSAKNYENDTEYQQIISTIENNIIK